MLAFVIAALALVVPELQPRTYVSRDGGWSLRVEPLTRDGADDAAYVLTRGGHEVYRERHPFALWEARLTDDGHAAGYAYVGHAGTDGLGKGLHVVVLSPQGDVLLDERNARTPSGSPESSPVPRVRGVFLQAELGRLVVRVEDDRHYPEAEEWWAYDIRTGAALFRERPKLALGLEPAVQDAVAVASVPGTPLVLVHWFRDDWNARPREQGALFQLLDGERREVWRLALPHDYEERDKKELQRLLPAIREDGAVLGTSERGFELRQVAAGERVRYSVRRVDEKWAVVESAREPWVDAPETVAEVSVFQFERSTERLLGNDVPPLSRGVIDSGFGRILVQERDTRAFHVLDATGARVLLARPRTEDLDALRSPLELVCTGDGGVHAADGQYERRAVRFDADGASLGRVDLPARNLCFVPGDAAEAWGIDDATLVRVRDGRVDLRAPRRPDERWWRDVKDVTVSSDGIVAVLDVPHLARSGIPERTPEKERRAVVARFDRGGRPLSLHELPVEVELTHVAHAGPWVLVHCFAFDPWLLDVRSGEWRRLDLAAELGAEPVADLGLAPDGGALWAFEVLERRLRTYALPE